LEGGTAKLTGGGGWKTKQTAFCSFVLEGGGKKL